ncbi:MAG: periplasmic sensor hybrid histidine kinase [Rhodospirillaceae bacterium]|nr:MAG: periplasmic sensor hybrid histidine kinase [Rhodospirillaceae bacterium]
MAFKGLDVHTRLSLSFIAAVSFTVIACILAVTALHQLRASLDVIIDRHLPIIVAAYELAQQSEATVASAPNLVVSSTQGQRQTAHYRIRDQFAYSSELVAHLQDMDTQHTLPLVRIAEEHAQLSVTFEKLNDAVERHIHYRQRLSILLRELITLRRDLRQTIDIHASEVTSLLEVDHAAGLALDFLAACAAAIEVHDVEEARADYDRTLATVLAVVQRLPTEIAAALAPVLDRLTTIGQGDNNLFVVRRGDLQTSNSIDGLLSVYSHVSSRLVSAVDELISRSRTVVTRASKDSHALVRQQTILLIVLSSLCILGAILIAVHVSRSIIQRLLHLHRVMEIAATGQDVQINSAGSDEIARMAQAVEGFITARCQTEEALRTAKDAADVANLAKTRFLAAASHDLRQPLQALGLFVTALSDLPLAENVRVLAEKIAQSVAALRELLNALLDISKLDAGVVIPEHSVVSLTTLTGRLVTEFEPMAAAKGLRFIVGPCRGFVISDPVLLERMLRNLLSNAIRYTSKGSILVGCRCRGERIRVEVWDTGPGIPSDQKQEIFREFHQISRSNQNAGAGLGLAIVDRTARLLGHRIVVESRLQRGSLFAIEMEAAPAPVSASPETPLAPFQVQPVERTASFHRPVSSVLKGSVIVVIDDDPRIRDGLKLLLQGWGCMVVTAESGDEAVAELSRREAMPEAIIADYRLSVHETGDQAIVTLREAVDAPLPALLITGEISLEGLCEAYGLPVLRKPVASEQLLAFLERVLASREEQEEQSTAEKPPCDHQGDVSVYAER